MYTSISRIRSAAVGRVALIVGILGLLLGQALPASAGEGEYFPEVIILPDGFNPEGMAVSWKGVFYAG